MIMLAWYYHWIHAGIRDYDQAREDLFSRIAYATRYGHISYVEAMSIPWGRLKSYLRALDKIVKEEAKAFKPK